MWSINFELLGLKEPEVTIDVNINEEYMDKKERSGFTDRLLKAREKL